MKELIPTRYVTYEKADDATIEERKTICTSCPEFNTDTTVCNVCHCEQLKKWTFLESKCPIGKWTDISWSIIREKRNNKLTETDWWELPSQQPISEARLSYRQALRDITETYSSPDDVVWPTPPKENQ